MPADQTILKRAAELADAGASFVLATVVGAQGRTPRNIGARLLCLPDGSAHGTVGGGGLELMVIESARDRLDSHESGVERFVLAEEAEQCCGGVMEVYFEWHGSTLRCVVFGAGHVAHQLVPLLTPSALEIVVVDDRPEWNNEERFPRARRVLDFDAGADLALERPDSTLAVVLTYSHDMDLRLIVRLLERPPAYLGLIGSKSKWACFVGRLAARGVAEEAIGRVVCPVGLGDMGKEPTLVAVSIAGQILLEAKRHAKD